MAGATGLEPATSGVTGRRSNQLSYAPAASTRAGTPTPFGWRVSSQPPSNRAAETPALRYFDQFKPALNALETPVHAVEPALHRRKIDLQRGEITMQASDITFDRTTARDHLVELALHSVEAFVQSSEARSQEIHSCDHGCQAVVGDDGLEPPTLSV